MPTDSAPADGDVIFNRANVALARSQRLIQSWLPPKTPQELAQSKSEQELLDEDDKLFKPTPELLGLGASVPDADQDSLFKKRSGASNDRLLEQLLGKKAAKGHRASSKPQPAPKPSLDQNTAVNQKLHDDSDEDEGRASMVSSNSRPRGKGNASSNPRKRPVVSQNKSTVQAGEPSSDDEEDARPTKKRGGTYLDQLLSERATKKKRKQKTIN